MKIVLLVHRYWPSVGGVEKYVRHLASALMAGGHEVDIVAGATTEGLPPTATLDGIRIHRYPAVRSPMRMRLWFLRHAALLRRADVIHASNTHVLEHFWRMVGPVVDPRKVFLTRHGMSYSCPVPESEQRRAARTLGMAAGVVHDGAFIEKWLGVAPGICPDQGLFPPADDLTPVPEPPPTSGVFIGRLEADSGIHIYIDAVARLLRESGRAFVLHVYGDGSAASAVRERVAREGLPVRFYGRVPDAQQYITDSCFALIDGRMAIQECMARRRLVLAAYPDPLKKDYVGTEPFSPYLVAVGDGAELARQLCFYIDHPDARAAFVERAFQYSRTLTWERTAASYVSLWRERLAHPTLQANRWDMLRLAMSLNREVHSGKSGWAAAWAPPSPTIPVEALAVSP